jgi:hypothetical protein
MSQTFFSRQDPTEKTNRLSQLGISQGLVTLWKKGNKERFIFNVMAYDKVRSELVLNSKDDVPFPTGASLLCTFETRGMTFFSQIVLMKSIAGYWVLHCNSDLFKSERRNSYRLLTFPIYEVWTEFDLALTYEGGKLVDFKTKLSQTGLFKNFLQLIEPGDPSQTDATKLKIRVQDLSTTGMALHIGEIERNYFFKDEIFKNVRIVFTDETILIPEVKVVYVVDYISGDKNLKTFKVGLHFPGLSTALDDQLGKKINKLLRDNDFNKDFENFIK